MGHEYDRDKPPYAVFPGTFCKRRYLLHAQGERPDVAKHMALVAPEVKGLARRPSQGSRPSGNHAVQGLSQTWHGPKVAGLGQ